MTDALRLLLADADEAASPALAWRALAEVPRGRVPVIEPAQLFAGAADPCDLRVQRWGVVVPASADAVRLAAVAPLIAARAEEQGTAAADVRVLRFALGDEPRAWIKRNLPGADLRRPRYLLLLGDLDELPIELQRCLVAYDYFVGRLAFATSELVRAYVDKLIGWEAAARSSAGRVVLMSACTGHPDSAPDHGHARLMQPARELAAVYRDEGQPGHAYALDPAGELPVTLADLLAVARGRGAPTLLWTMSHGLGARADRERQGLVCFGAPGRGELLTPADVASGPFLPGGVWFLFSCFGAGTPERSVYAPWLRRLQTDGRLVAQALRHLPGPGEPPFVAATPMAALANPEGPLAVLGHVDLAWIHGYADVAGDPVDPHERFLRLPSLLVDPTQRWRVGAAVARFGRLHEVDASLTDMAAEEEARADGATPGGDPAAYGHLWMHRQDLANYVLLGDPAARLPIRGREAA